MGRRRMRSAPVPLLAVLTLAACSSAIGPEASCIAVVNVDGIDFGPSPSPPLAAADLSDPGTPYAVVSRNTGCLDEGQNLEGPVGGPLGPPGSGGVNTGPGLAPGESNFLTEGTELYTVVGFEPSERLAYWADVVGEWLALEPYRAED